MEDTIIFPEPFNVIYFPCDISSVAFSSGSNYLAVAGEEGLVVFQANTQLSMFEPIARDVQKGVNILALQWTASDSIEYLCLGIKDRSLKIHRVNISPMESDLTERPAETSYTIDSLWKYKRTPWQRGHKACRYKYGANGVYFAGISNRSVEIFKSGSKFKPKHGFTSDFTPKVEMISNIVRQLNNIEMQQSSNQDEDSNARDKSFNEKDSLSMKKDHYLNPDAVQKQPIFKWERDEDKESLSGGKRQKQDHRHGEDRPLLVSKRGRDEDKESLSGGKRQKQDHRHGEDRPLLVSKRGRDEDVESIPEGKKIKQDHRHGEDRPLLVSKRGRDEDEESIPEGKKIKQDHRHGEDRSLLVSKRVHDEDGEDNVDGAESVALSKKTKFHEDKENQDVKKTPMPKKKSRTKESRR